ncbi:MAG: hypothetical protein R2702_06325 [Acidimicrobiales bacterium]
MTAACSPGTARGAGLVAAAEVVVLGGLEIGGGEPAASTWMPCTAAGVGPRTMGTAGGAGGAADGPGPATTDVDVVVVDSRAVVGTTTVEVVELARVVVVTSVVVVGGSVVVEAARWSSSWSALGGRRRGRRLGRRRGRASVVVVVGGSVVVVVVGGSVVVVGGASVVVVVVGASVVVVGGAVVVVVVGQHRNVQPAASGDDPWRSWGRHRPSQWWWSSPWAHTDEPGICRSAPTRISATSDALTTPLDPTFPLRAVGVRPASSNGGLDRTDVIVATGSLRRELTRPKHERQVPVSSYRAPTEPTGSGAGGRRPDRQVSLPVRNWATGVAGGNDSVVPELR